MRGVGYAAWEIAVLLAAALAVGVALGWVLRQLLYDTSVTRLESRAAIAERRTMILAAELARLQATAKAQPEAEAGPVIPGSGAAPAGMTEVAARTAGGRPPPDDDLKVVHGIGPAIERRLKEMGITSLRQIAALEPDDVAVVTAALGSFPGRIDRDNWIGSAADEYRKRYGNEP